MFNFSRISNRIKKNEGFKSSVYRDQLRNLTIGYGHLIGAKDTFYLKKKYSKKVLLEIFYKDLRSAISNFKTHYQYKFLPSNVQEVIIEMIFQLGIKKTLKFKKFNFYINQEKFYLAALEMMKSLWYQQTPHRVNKLIFILLKNDVRRNKK